MNIIATSHTPLYDSPVWGFIGVPVAIVIGAALVWLGYRAISRRGKLTWQVTEFALLNRASPLGSDPDLSVFYGDSRVNDPRVLEVRLTNSGRADIPSSAFDRDTPLTIDVGGRVVALIPGETGETTVRADVSGTEVRVPPMLIRRRQVVTLRALVEAPARDVTVAAELIEVDVLQDTSMVVRRPPLRRVVAIAVAQLLIVTLTHKYLLPADAQKAPWTTAASLYTCIIGVTGYFSIRALIPRDTEPMNFRFWVRPPAVEKQP